MGLGAPSGGRRRWSHWLFLLLLSGWWGRRRTLFFGPFGVLNTELSQPCITCCIVGVGPRLCVLLEIVHAFADYDASAWTEDKGSSGTSSVS